MYFCSEMHTDGMKIRALWHDERCRQFVRFALNGGLSSAIHYAVYYVLLYYVNANVAYISGYLVSFVINFFLTCYFTFRTTPTLKRFVGFCGSHAVNFGLHVVLFNLFLQLGVHRLVIPLLVIGIAMIVQFTILKWVFTHQPAKREDLSTISE